MSFLDPGDLEFLKETINKLPDRDEHLAELREVQNMMRLARLGEPLDEEMAEWAKGLAAEEAALETEVLRCLENPELDDDEDVEEEDFRLPENHPVWTDPKVYKALENFVSLDPNMTFETMARPSPNLKPCRDDKESVVRLAFAFSPGPALTAGVRAEVIRLFRELHQDVDSWSVKKSLGSLTGCLLVYPSGLGVNMVEGSDGAIDGYVSTLAQSNMARTKIVNSTLIIAANKLNVRFFKQYLVVLVPPHYKNPKDDLTKPSKRSADDDHYPFTSRRPPSPPSPAKANRTTLQHTLLGIQTRNLWNFMSLKQVKDPEVTLQQSSVHIPEVKTLKQYMAVEPRRGLDYYIENKEKIHDTKMFWPTPLGDDPVTNFDALREFFHLEPTQLDAEKIIDQLKGDQEVRDLMDHYYKLQHGKSFWPDGFQPPRTDKK